MRKIERKNTGLLVTSSTISKIGDTLFDYVNNSFLASMNVKSMVLVGVYQALENVIGALFNLFGGVIADRFRRKKIIILSDLSVLVSYFQANLAHLCGHFNQCFTSTFVSIFDTSL